MDKNKRMVTIKAAHEPALGRGADGQWSTKKLAEYPQSLNNRIATCIVLSKGTGTTEAAGSSAAKAEPVQ